MRAFLLLFVAALGQGQDFAARVESLLAEFPAVARGAWGIKAVNLTTGETVYERNASSTFVPASNMKLYTTAFALTRLGPEHRFVTRVYVTAPPDERGTVNGDLILVGGGDPSLSGREIPYRKNGAWSDALGPLDALAAELAAQGVRRITGDVIGDDRAYVWEPFPPGWAQDDTLYEYGAPVSALTLHDNFVTVTLTPSEPGQLAHVRVVPETGYFQILSTVTSNGRGSARVDEERGGDPRTLRLSGSVSRASSLFLAVGDPAHYAAHALRDLLLRRGITVDGRAAARHRFAGEGAGADPEPGVKIAERASPPLSDLVKVVNKVSQNLHAEILLREVARARGKAGSRREALDDLSSFLKGLGASSEDFALYDGSGLSRLTLISPETTLRVLRFMHEGANRGIWLDSLPVGGEDGTLSARFKGFQDGTVRAKTGTLSHCTSLAGYLETATGETIAFSMMANNANTNAAGIRGFFDKVAGLLAANGKLQ